MNSTRWIILMVVVLMLGFLLGALHEFNEMNKYPIISCINLATLSVDVDSLSEITGDIAYSLPEKVCIRHLYNISIPDKQEPDMTIFDGGKNGEIS